MNDKTKLLLPLQGKMSQEVVLSDGTKGNFHIEENDINSIGHPFVEKEVRAIFTSTVHGGFDVDPAKIYDGALVPSENENENVCYRIKIN